MNTPMTKTEFMQMITAGNANEAFTVVYPDGTEHVFNITLMRKKLAAGLFDIHNVAITPNVIDALSGNNRDIDEERIANLSYDQYRNDPAILVQYPDDNQIVDGAHRILRRHREGFKFFRTWIVPFEEAIMVDNTYSNHKDLWGKQNFIEKNIARKRQQKVEEPKDAGAVYEQFFTDKGLFPVGRKNR